MKATSLSSASLLANTEFKMFEMKKGLAQPKTDLVFKPAELLIHRDGMVTGLIQCGHYPISYSFDIAHIDDLRKEYSLPTDEQIFTAGAEVIKSLFGMEFDESLCRSVFELGNMPSHQFKELLASRIGKPGFPL
ncbi:hypothetical protein [Flavobacterium sp.]|uniref:hypothetical protein n=1 Tax=Flavobacterium sp. TaxID=239 RepID=UPI0026361069|nr:hypothetical protein [Flavobacterium sp.]